MKIKPVDGYFTSHKQHSLNPDLTVKQINQILSPAGIQDEGESGDGKCKHTWNFSADGRHCSIWDYKGARWSAYGPIEAFKELCML